MRRTFIVKDYQVGQATSEIIPCCPECKYGGGKEKYLKMLMPVKLYSFKITVKINVRVKLMIFRREATLTNVMFQKSDETYLKTY